MDDINEISDKRLLKIRESMFTRLNINKNIKNAYFFIKIKIIKKEFINS
jgi:hypothetical protein